MPNQQICGICKRSDGGEIGQFSNVFSGKGGKVNLSFEDIEICAECGEKIDAQIRLIFLPYHPQNHGINAALIVPGKPGANSVATAGHDDIPTSADVAAAVALVNGHESENKSAGVLPKRKSVKIASATEEAIK